MKYDQPELINRLAAEYVLGTLHGKARVKFEKLMKQRKDIDQAVSRWETHFSEMTKVVPEKEPPKTVWNAITNDINPTSDSEKQSSGLFSSLMFWKTWSVLATGASFVLALMLLAPQSIEQSVFDPSLDHVALVGDQAEPLWVIGANLETGELTARAINASAAGLDKAFELWMLPTEGSPQSIGLLPVNGGRTTHQLPAALLALLKDSKGLAISIEPAGGSPTGLPTGPVIQTAKIIGL